MVSDIAVLGSGLGQGTRQTWQQQVRRQARTWAPTTLPSPHPAQGMVALGWGAQQWGEQLGLVEELPGNLLVLPSPGGPWVVLGAHTPLLWSGEP